jgi:hypothetical protein
MASGGRLETIDAICSQFAVGLPGTHVENGSLGIISIPVSPIVKSCKELSRAL